MTEPVPEWRFRAGALADSLVASGAIGDPSWRIMFAATPRHVFVPRYWDVAVDGAPGTLVDGSDEGHRSAWLAAVYSDRSLATQLGTVAVDGAAIPVVSTTAPAPSAAAVMLDRLELRGEHRVLEIGTGTGYLTAFLAARVGADQVTSIDVDPQQLALAADHLYAIGHRPSLAIADPLDGWPAGAPYDRILVTGAVGRVPRAWIEQLAQEGRIVIPLEVGQALAVLDRVSRGELTGRIDRRAVDILALSARDRPPKPVPVGVGSSMTAWFRAAKVGTTSLSPSLLAYPDVRLWLALHLPGAQILDARPTPTGVPFATVISTAQGRAMIGHRSTGDQSWPVAQDAHRIWNTVEAALDAYQRAGRPTRDRLGVTIRVEPPEQSLWLGSPHSTYRWLLPAE